MKKITLLLGAVAMIAFASCKKTETKTDDTMKDTTAAPVETPAMPADTTAASSPIKDTTAIVKTGKSDETTISAGKDGVSVKSDNGSKSTTVKVSKDNSVQVKK